MINHEKEKIQWLSIILLVLNLLVSLIIILAGTSLINQHDTNGYFVICIGLQFFIIRTRKRTGIDN